MLNKGYAVFRSAGGLTRVCTSMTVHSNPVKCNSCQVVGSRGSLSFAVTKSYERRRAALLSVKRSVELPRHLGDNNDNTGGRDHDNIKGVAPSHPAWVTTPTPAAVTTTIRDVVADLPQFVSPSATSQLSVLCMCISSHFEADDVMSPSINSYVPWEAKS